MRFINTDLFSPVAKGFDLPDKEDYFHKQPGAITKEFLKRGDYFIDDLWWHVQLDRCMNGYEVPNTIEKGGDVFEDDRDAFWDGNDCYIPMYDLLFKNKTVKVSGRMYWYLNFWPIYRAVEGKISKTYANPRFLALDYFFYHRVEMMFRLMKDNQDLKGRQEGFSMKLAGGISGWNFTFVPDSQTLIVAGIQEDSTYTFSQCALGLDLLRNTQFFKDKEIDNESHVQAANTGASVRAITAKDNPQALSRFSPFVIIYEEIGKGKKNWSIKVSRYVKPSIVTEGKKTGWQLFIGTAGEEGEGVADLEERHYHPEENNLLAFPNVFEEDRSGLDKKVAHHTGKDWYHIVDQWGNPMREKSREVIRNEQALMTIEERLKDITQRAIWASDAFATGTLGFFGEDIVIMLKRRKIYLQSHSAANIVRTGRLEFVDPEKPIKGVRWKADEKGWLKIVEEPEENEVFDESNKLIKGEGYMNLYFAGADSYDQDEAYTSNSKGAFYVRKMFRPNSGSAHFNTYVAQVVERPSVEDGGAEEFYKHCAMVSIWYKAKVNIEYSNLRIFDWFMNAGLEHLLMERPRLAFAGKVMNSLVSNRYGTDRSLKPQILAILKDRLTEEFIDRLYFIEQVDALSRFKYDPSGKRYNCDITVATAEAEVAAKEQQFSVVKSRNEVNKQKGYQIYKRDMHGNLVARLN